MIITIVYHIFVAPGYEPKNNARILLPRMELLIDGHSWSMDKAVW